VSDATRLDRELLPPSLMGRVDEVCDRFEAAWKAGERPNIEECLGDVTGPARSILLLELIALEVDYRRRQGEAPQPEEYVARFSALHPQEIARAVGARSLAHPAVTAQVKRIRCPHCHNPIQLIDDRSEEVLCPGCGSSFRIRDARVTDTVSGMRRLRKFQLLERVGLGAFGAVWRARDTELDRIVAMKIPHTGLLTSTEELERFHREARAAAQLRHAGVVTVHEVWQRRWR
jgi:serine/threonine-protein kinase